MKLSVNFIGHRKYWDAGTDIPNHLVPDWARLKYRIGDLEAREICARAPREDGSQEGSQEGSGG